MADFTSGFWNIYITVLTLLGIVGCAVLLWSQSIKKVGVAAGSGGADANAAQVGTTGHVWDEDLMELNTPMPRWWRWSTKNAKSSGVPKRCVGAKKPVT